MNKIITIIVTISFLSPYLFAQDKHQIESSDFSLSKGNVIWIGSGDISSSKEYIFTNFEFQSTRQTSISWDFRRLKMIDSTLGLGIQSQNTFYIGDFFESINYGYLNIGPVIRKYIHQSSKMATYTEGAILFGYDMALADATGNSPSGFRYRPGLKLGTSYFINNRTGFFAEIGPDWEGDFTFEKGSIDSKALQLQFGVKIINK